MRYSYLNFKKNLELISLLALVSFMTINPSLAMDIEETEELIVGGGEEEADLDVELLGTMQRMKEASQVDVYVKPDPA